MIETDSIIPLCDFHDDANNSNGLRMIHRTVNRHHTLKVMRIIHVQSQKVQLTSVMKKD